MPTKEAKKQEPIGARTHRATDMALTPRQARFVEEYLLDLNATQAAIRAGYSPAGAKVRGSELLTNRNVAEAIERERQNLSERTQMDQDWVLTRLARIVDADLRQLFDDRGHLIPAHELPADLAAAISSLHVHTTERSGGTVEHVVKVRLHNRLEALSKIGQHLGMFGDRRHVTEQEESGPSPYDQGSGLSRLSPEERAQYQAIQRKLAEAEGCPIPQDLLDPEEVDEQEAA